MLDVQKIKKDFPIFLRQVEGNELVYLDSAATSQKPQAVVDAVSDFYTKHNANVHRGIYTLSEEATQLYEDAREKVARFIGAGSPSEITFTKGTTESINRINYEWGVENIKKGDVILTTQAEHHSNLIPWQILSQITGAKLEFVEVDQEGNIDWNQFKEKITEKVKLVAIFHASNVLGTVAPVKEICRLAKKAGAVVLVDGAQAIPHFSVNVRELGCDFYAFSGHKMLGPMGIGVLWAKKEHLDKMEPYEYGGGMVETATFMKSSWACPPEKFEAGTPNVSGAVGLAAAIDYLEGVGMENISKYEADLVNYAFEKLGRVKGLKIFGPKKGENRCGLVSFSLEKIHPHDVSAVLSSCGVAVRAGQHCAMPLHERLGVIATTRASFYLYNTKEDIDALVEGIEKAMKML